MVTHTTIQRYKQNYGTRCITGLFGCKWHRYRQSLSHSRKTDLIWFVVLLAAVLYMTFWLYFWVVNINVFDLLNWYIYDKTQTWFPWYSVFLGVTCIVSFYAVFVMVLALGHACIRHQIYMHHVHRVLLVVILVCSVTATIAFKYLQNGMPYNMVFLSLLMFGPFLQIGAVAVTTALTWIIAEKWYYLQSWGSKIFWLFIYLCVMVGLYLSPLFVKTPCLSSEKLPAKPLLMAHRGASLVSPENTNISFLIAATKFKVWGLESDVQISLDGTPFLLHDKTLKRTTNVEDVFPRRQDEPAENFNFTDLRQLDAGSWFLEDDPMGTVPYLKDHQKAAYKGQKILALYEYIYLAKALNKSVMFDVRMPDVKHPFHNHTLNIVAGTIRQVGIDPERVLWLNKTGDVSRIANFTIVVGGTPKPAIRQLKMQRINMVNARTDHLSLRDIFIYGMYNVSSNIYVVNTAWLFSLYWCLGVRSVTTDSCNSLSQLSAPIWQLTPSSYLILWICCDVVSALIIVTIFIIHRRRWNGHTRHSETIHLQQRRQRHQRNRIMKEKLLYSDEQPDRLDMHEEEETEIKRRSRASQNGYARSSYSGSVENRSIVLDDELTDFRHDEIQIAVAS